MYKILSHNPILFAAEYNIFNQSKHISKLNLFESCVRLIFYTGSTDTCTPYRRLFYIRIKINPNKLTRVVKLLKVQGAGILKYTIEDEKFIQVTLGVISRSLITQGST